MTKRAVNPTEKSDPLFDQFLDLIQGFWSFLVTFQIELFVIFGLLAGLTYFFKINKKKESEIKKMWIFTLFFLTKRQMMIPLVVTLAKKDQILDEDVRERLLIIRDRCRKVSLKKDPINRLELEQQVSKVLYYYFSNLEAKGLIEKGTKFEKIVRDLEFIDAKLVQLQHVYNREAEKWNKTVTNPLVGWFHAIFRFHPFEKFEMPR